jgi:hypothetical protein
MGNKGEFLRQSQGREKAKATQTHSGVHFFGFEAGSVCLESAQIDSYLNLSEDWEPKSYQAQWVNK